MIQADLIFVIGSGFGDLHLNTWLHEARSRNPKTPILVIDRWEGGFLDSVFDRDHKLIQMFHALEIHIGVPYDGTEVGNGWIISKDGTAAIWEKGFQAFLQSPAELQHVLGQL